MGYPALRRELSNSVEDICTDSSANDILETKLTDFLEIVESAVPDPSDTRKKHIQLLKYRVHEKWHRKQFTSLQNKALWTTHMSLAMDSRTWSSSVNKRVLKDIYSSGLHLVYLDEPIPQTALATPWPETALLKELHINFIDCCSGNLKKISVSKHNVMLG